MAPYYLVQVRVASHSTSPQCGPIRFRPLICTYAPWGVRVDELAKSRTTPTRNNSLLFLLSRSWARTTRGASHKGRAAPCRSGHRRCLPLLHQCSTLAPPLLDHCFPTAPPLLHHCFPAAPPSLLPAHSLTKSSRLFRKASGLRVDKTPVFLGGCNCCPFLLWPGRLCCACWLGVQPYLAFTQ